MQRKLTSLQPTLAMYLSWSIKWFPELLSKADRIQMDNVSCEFTYHKSIYLSSAMSIYAAQVIQVTKKSKYSTQRFLFILVLNVANLSRHQSFL